MATDSVQRDWGMVFFNSQSQLTPDQWKLFRMNPKANTNQNNVCSFCEESKIVLNHTTCQICDLQTCQHYCNQYLDKNGSTICDDCRPLPMTKDYCYDCHCDSHTFDPCLLCNNKICTRPWCMDGNERNEKKNVICRHCLIVYHQKYQLTLTGKSFITLAKIPTDIDTMLVLLIGTIAEQSTLALSHADFTKLFVQDAFVEKQSKWAKEMYKQFQTFIKTSLKKKWIIPLNRS